MYILSAYLFNFSTILFSNNISNLNFIALLYYHRREIQALITSFGSNLHVDLQQRGVEFTQLFGTYQHLRPALLEKMPAMQINRLVPHQQQNGDNSLVSGGLYDENTGDLIENGLLNDKQQHLDNNINDNTVSERYYRNCF